MKTKKKAIAIIHLEDCNQETEFKNALTEFMQLQNFTGVFYVVPLTDNVIINESQSKIIMNGLDECLDCKKQKETQNAK
jgi:hypothetical protein